MQQQHNDRFNRRSLKALRLPKINLLPQQLSFLIAPLVLALAGLACDILGTGSQPASGRDAVLTHLPTLTPTASLPTAPVDAATAVTGAPASALPPPSPSPEAASNEAPRPSTSLPTLTPTPLAVAASEQAAAPPQDSAQASELPGEQTAAATAAPTTAPPTSTPVLSDPNWSFANIQLYPDQYGGGLLMYGDAINNTGVSQELTAITGAFYDAQGQLVADRNQTIDFWPIPIVPAQARLPFELTILGVQDVANYDLSVEAQPTEGDPHQAFEFLDVSEWEEDGLHCLSGSLQNQGEPLHEYVMAVAIFYDKQDHMIKFGEFYETDFENPIDSQPVPFDICIELTGQEIARHELRAWGE